MYDTRLEMASGWLWNFRTDRRMSGQPSVRPFGQQPPDVTEPIEAEVTEILRAVDVYDDVRDIIRVDLRQVKALTAKLYQGLYPDWETSMTQEKLDALEGTVKVMLHHLRVEGDAPYDL